MLTKLKPCFLAFFLFTCTTVFAQHKFKIGDHVESTYAGDWLRAVVVGGYEENEFGSTYEIKYDGISGTSRVNTKWVRELFRPDADQTFAVGDVVEFRRWDDTVYEGEIIGVDGKRYNISYQRDGYSTTEWVNEIAVRPSQKTVAAKPGAKPVQAKAEEGKVVPGQQFKIGDQVLYDDLGFLATKHWGIVTSYNPKTRLYTVRNEKDPSLNYSYACYQVVLPNEQPATDFFIGKWDVRISGAITSSEEGGKRTTTVSGGMKLPPLEIKADGTYTWVYSNKKIIRGRWIPRDGVPGITILKGLDGLDWTVYETTEAFGTTPQTRDEIRFHNLPTQTGYYVAQRIGPNRSCVLTGRTF